MVLATTHNKFGTLPNMSVLVIYSITYKRYVGEVCDALVDVEVFSVA
jgi:hypothetical protein